MCSTAEAILRYNLQVDHEANTPFWDDYDLSSIIFFEEVPDAAAWMMTTESNIMIFQGD